MKFTKLQIPFYFGLAILAIGILFKIQHYPGAELMIGAGLLLEVLFVILVLTEIITSKKAAKNLKILWVMWKGSSGDCSQAALRPHPYGYTDA